MPHPYLIGGRPTEQQRNYDDANYKGDKQRFPLITDQIH